MIPRLGDYQLAEHLCGVEPLGANIKRGFCPIDWDKIPRLGDYQLVEHFCGAEPLGANIFYEVPSSTRLSASGLSISGMQSGWGASCFSILGYYQ